MLTLIDPHVKEIELVYNTSSGKLSDLDIGDKVIFNISYDNKPGISMLYQIDYGYYMWCRNSSDYDENNDSDDDIANDLLFRRISTNLDFQKLFVRQFKLTALLNGYWIEMKSLRKLIDELKLIESLTEF